MCNVPDYGTTRMGLHAIAMMLTFARGTASLDAAVRADLKAYVTVHNVTARRLRDACSGDPNWGASARRPRCARWPRLQAGFYILTFRMARAAFGFTRAARCRSAGSPMRNQPTAAHRYTRSMMNAAAVLCDYAGRVPLTPRAGRFAIRFAARRTEERQVRLSIDVLPRERPRPRIPWLAWQANEPSIPAVCSQSAARFYSPASLHRLLSRASRRAISTCATASRDCVTPIILIIVRRKIPSPRDRRRPRLIPPRLTFSSSHDLGRIAAARWSSSASVRWRSVGAA